GTYGGRREFSGRLGSTNIVCFNCGGTGHISTVCKNPPLSYAEQKRIRDESRAERDAKFGVPTSGGGENRTMTAVIEKALPRAQSAFSVGMATLSMDSQPSSHITELTSGGEDKQVSNSSVSCIKVVSVAADKGIVGQACSTLMRMPAVAAIFKKAMVDK